MYQERTYRNLVQKNNLVSFKVVVKETDVQVHADQYLEDFTRDRALEFRGYIESYIDTYPEFEKTMVPWYTNNPTPKIINEMIAASAKAGVGPMAAVAGAIAEYIGKGLLQHSKNVIVENGGDIFFKVQEPVTIGIYAGKSPLSMRIGLRVDTKSAPLSICTSSGTIGHSLSYGKADAVSVLSKSCALSDAAATSIANHVKSKSDIQSAINFGKKIEGILGLVIIIDDKMGLWGDIEVVPFDDL